MLSGEQVTQGDNCFLLPNERHLELAITMMCRERP